MPAAGKKFKLFKVCKELNIGIETISSFLKEKGVKVAGPNTPISAEMYEEILINFAREKEMADKLLQRKTHVDSGETGSEEVVGEEKVVEKSEYIQTIERSIEERIEAIKKKDEQQEEEELAAAAAKSLAKETESESQDLIEQVKEIINQEPESRAVDGVKEADNEEATKEEEKPLKKVYKMIDLGPDPRKDKGLVKKEVDKKEDDKKEKPVKKEKAKEKDTEKEAPGSKEEKRRKAMEMIRKDEKKRKNFVKSGGVDGAEGGRRQRSRKQKKKTVDQKEVQQTIKKTLASIDEKLKKSKRRKKIKDETGEEIEENIIQASEFISASDLANLMDVPATDIIKKCLELGLVVSINQRLDIDTIELLAGEWGFTVQKEEEYASDIIDDLDESDDALEDDETRPPIITIMGHVDHGKTSLLDHIRETNVVAGESGGITQHIGAYSVEKNGRKITFLDTPGHEAFTAMRARGAQVTDIVVLVIAADDDVKPQTDEAIDHVRAAGVKLIIAINKIDKPEANVERVKQQLAERNILVEDWGGEYQSAEISAKTGKGIDALLEKVLIESDMLDLKANSKRRARGTVIESQLDRGKGVISTVLVQNGSLKIGDPFIAGQYSGKVRALLNEKDQRLDIASPSQPVQVLGFDGLPQAGDRFAVMEDEQTVKEISSRRQRIKREQDYRQVKLRTLDQISESIKTGGVKELRIIVKADVDGSAEALADSLIKISTSEVAVDVIRKAVGPISESDVLLAAASDAIIIGFHVRPNVKAKELAQQEDIEIRFYRVVYDAINDVRLALEGMLETEKREEITGMVEIREIYKISRLGTIAGCHVKSGKITRNSRIRLIREDVSIYEGQLSSLKRFKDDAKEVATGFECGLQIQNYNDLKAGDMIEVFEIVEHKRTLDAVR